MNIGNTIQKIRKDRGFSQVELAEKIGITQTSLSLIESGKKNPSKQTIKKISDILEIPEPFIYFLSSDENDIPKDKRETFKILEPTIKNAIYQLFNE